jgi:hypothetical protein
MPRNTPGFEVSYLDNQLNVGPQEATLNESILVIGTAEDGPTDTVIRMRSPAYIRSVYGRNSVGDLVRKAEEAWYAQRGSQDIRLLRISNGRKAKLAIAESSGRGAAKPQPTGQSITGQTILTNPALVLEAKVPGMKYNQATTRMGYNPNGLLSVIFYNPKTGMESYYTYSADPNNIVVDVHNVRELAAAMAADPNASAIITATANTIEGHADILLDPQGSSGYSSADWTYDAGYFLSLWGYKDVTSELAEMETITATPSSTGNTLPAGEYCYSVTARNENGQTNGSYENPLDEAESAMANATVTTGQQVALTWSHGVATTFHVYRGLVGITVVPTGVAALPAAVTDDFDVIVVANDKYGHTKKSAVVTVTSGVATVISWTAVAGAVSYSLYGATHSATSWNFISTVETNSATITISSAPTGALYHDINTTGARYRIASPTVASLTDTGLAIDSYYPAPTVNDTKYWGGFAPDSGYGNIGYYGASDVSGKLQLRLSTRTLMLPNETGAPTIAPSVSDHGNGSYGGGFFRHFNNTDAVVSQTAGNRIASLTKVGELGCTVAQILNAPGYSKMDLPYTPVVPPPVRFGASASQDDFTFTSKLRPIQKYLDGDTELYKYPPVMGRYGYGEATAHANVVGSESDFADAVQLITKGFVGTVPVLEDGTTTVEFEFAAHLPPDIGSDGRIAGRYDYTYLLSTYGLATYCEGADTVVVYEVVSGGDFINAADLGHNYTITWEELPGQEPTAKVTFDDTGAGGLPDANTSIYIDYKSLPGKLTQVSNLMSVLNKTGWDAWKTYFIAGRRLYFGGPLPTALQIAYCFEKNWHVGGDVSVIDYSAGILEWSDLSDQPGTSMNQPMPVIITPEKAGAVPAPDWSSVSDAADHRPEWSRITLYYDYDPEWLDIGMSSRTLQGGSDGAVMSAEDLYDTMDSAYLMLSNYNFDHLILPDGAYLDAVKTEPNPVTGLQESVNAGFQTQLTSFLDVLLTNVHETMAYMSVTPPADTKLATVQKWVQRLVTVDPSDPTRGANWQSVLSNRLVHMMACYPIVANPSVVRYVSDGIPSFVGTYAELPINQGMTYRQIPTWVGLAFELSPGQLETMTAMRYITGKTDVYTGSLVVTDVPSCAAAGSDYTRSTTTRIVRRVVDQVRKAAIPFLGRLSEPAIYNACATQVSNVLKQNITDGSLRNNSTFTLNATQADRIRGYLNIGLSLAVNFEIRIINIRVALSK